MDYSIKIGGEAGQGIQTIGDTLAKVFARTGYHVITHQDYESRIRGGHNFYQIRFSENPVSASTERIDILVALDMASLNLHAQEVNGHGHIIYDSASLREKAGEPGGGTMEVEAARIPPGEKKEGKAEYLDVPFINLAVEHGGNRIMANTVATGAVLGMLKFKLDVLLGILEDTFRKKGDEVIRSNISAAHAGYNYAVDQCLTCSFLIEDVARPKMLINGTKAIGLGAVASGCKFYAAYPMTPSTGVMNYIAGKEKEYGIIVEQSEDEISAINMVLGASFAGVRAMTGTSGGGFALMVEGLSLSGITETPAVIAFGQRPGPATGLPTRTEQGDLLFVIHSGHGEFPRVVFAPGTPEEAFFLTNKAFHLAEKYQIPAFVFFDQYLADAEWTYEGFDTGKIVFSEYRMKGDAFKALVEYKRHALTETGVSPLAVPGDAPHVVVTDSDEHSEEGHIIEDAHTRKMMIEKRLYRKTPQIRNEMSPPLFYGSEKPEMVIAGWGSTYGVIKEAVDRLSGQRKVAMLHFSEIYPFPSTDRFDYLKLLRDTRVTVCVENNATGQFARLMKAETGYAFTREIHRYDGRPFMVEGLMGELHADD
jgi:2-oxoglutarate ferredoxin oxidoreductase subunit alpha